MTEQLNTAYEHPVTQTAAAPAEKAHKVPFTAPVGHWTRALFFLLSLSLLGLHCPLGYLFVPLAMLNSFVKDRYDFLMQCILAGGGYAFFRVNELPVGPPDIVLAVSLIGIAIYKRNHLINKICLGMAAYFAVLIAMALLSEEKMSVQFRLMRGYFMIVSFIIPLLVFSGRKFDIMRFSHKAMIYSFIACGFYIVDAFILEGHVLIPAIHMWGFDEDARSTWLNPIMHPFTFNFPRKYPQSLYILAFCIIPVIRRYKLSRFQWAVIIIAIISTRTMTFTAALVVCYFIFLGKARQMIKYALLGTVAFVGLYFVDSATGGFMRVQSTTDQFFALSDAMDDEDVAEFGSGRMAQWIPKYELLTDLNREWTGFGFLHPKYTTNPKYQIKNEYYEDVSKSEEVATTVEVTQFQAILDTGYIGLIAQTAFYLWVYALIRRMRYSDIYLLMLIANTIFGVGGFAGLNVAQGLILQGAALGMVLLLGLPRNAADRSPIDGETSSQPKLSQS